MRQYLYLFVALIGVIGCQSKAVETQEEIQELPVIEVTSRDTVLHQNYVASIEAIKNVEIRARVQGFLNKIFVDEGEEVKKGQLLFQIDPKEFEIEVSKAKANVSNAIAEAKTAEVELSRVKILLSKNIVAPSEQEMMEAKLNAAKAKIEEAQSEQRNAETRLSYTWMRSPFDGIIDRIPLKTGSLIDAGSLLTTISDNREVYAYFTVSESEYLRYKKDVSNTRNNKVNLILADGEAYKDSGMIETVDGEFDEATGSIAFRARFPNDEKLLRHGASGKVQLTVPAEKVLLIPQKCVFEIQDKNYVFLVTSDNTVKMKGVIPQARLSDAYLIKEGLTIGDKIVYEGVQNIKEGAKILPKPVTNWSL